MSRIDTYFNFRVQYPTHSLLRFNLTNADPRRCSEHKRAEARIREGRDRQRQIDEQRRILE